MISRMVLSLVLAASFTLAMAGESQAQYGACGFYGYGYGYDIGNLYRVLGANVPYYAAFPPVYYSVPVPRTYGYSPFAYPPGVMTPEVAETAEPVEITNPHFIQPTADTSEDKVTVNTGVVQPLVIVNPYTTDHLVDASRLRR